MPQNVAGSARNLGHVKTFRMNKFSDSGLPFLGVTVIFDAALLVPNDENLKITTANTFDIQARQSPSLLKKNLGKLGLLWTGQVMPHKLDMSSICSSGEVQSKK